MAGAGLQYETEFMVDYSGDEPEHKVRLTLNLEDVQELRQAAYSAFWFNDSLVLNKAEAAFHLAQVELFRRIEKRLAGPSLFSQTDFKATNKQEAA